MSEFTAIRYSIENKVAEIVLDRPESLNSMNAAMRLELTQAFRRAPDDGARAILLTGEGRAFCSGQDLGETPGGAPIDVERVLREEYEPMVLEILGADLPVVVAVNGIAAGAGASLALLGDVVYAARSASFVIAFARIGLVPDVAATYFLPRLIGLPRALGMAMTTEPVSGEQAAEWGLVWKVSDDEALLSEARMQAAAFAEGPTRAYALTRKTMRQGLETGVVEQLRREATAQAEAAATDDFKEGASAFLQKRAPKYQGR